MSATTTQTLTQRTVVAERTNFDDEQQELASRGLLNSNYDLVKKVVAEQMVVSFAATTAVLLQIAYPGVGRGVGLHSNFALRMIERHENTMMYIYTMVFGSGELRATMKSFVDKRHKYVNDNKKGKTYDALDPKLQCWVAFTLYATYVPVYEELFGQFTDAEREQVLQEFSILGTSLQVPLHMWPRNLAEAEKYYDDVVNNVLEITEPCKKTINELANATNFMPWKYKVPLYILLPLRWNATTQRLPDRARELLGLQKTFLNSSFDYATIQYLKWTYTYLPDSVRTYAVRHYLSKAEALKTKGRLR